MLNSESVRNLICLLHHTFRQKRVRIRYLSLVTRRMLFKNDPFLILLLHGTLALAYIEVSWANYLWLHQTEMTLLRWRIFGDKSCTYLMFRCITSNFYESVLMSLEILRLLFLLIF